ESLLDVQIPATVQGTPLSLAAVSAAPTAVNDTFTVLVSSPGQVLNVTGNDSANVSGGKLGVVATTAPAHGTLTVQPDGVTVPHTPNAGCAGADSFTYTVSGTVQVATVPRETLATVGGTPVHDGYGSALAAVPGTTNEFYSMTDRGPNVDATPTTT